MCLILVAWRQHDEYPFFVAANRDEFRARPTAPAAWWTDHPQILAGRDLGAGGTWLGITRTGRFAALTNFRGSARHRADAPSRGALVTSLLLSGESVETELDRLRRVGGAYNGFSLIFSDGRRLGIFESAVGEGRELGPGVYGLSNHLLDTPWPKVINSKSQLLAAIDDEVAALAMLRDDRPPSDHELPRTGMDPEWERRLSSVFVRGPEYGTRCSTILGADVRGHVHFDEWTWDAAGEEAGRVSLRFRATPSV